MDSLSINPIAHSRQLCRALRLPPRCATVIRKVMVFHLSQPPVRSNRMMTPDIQLRFIF